MTNGGVILKLISWSYHHIIHSFFLPLAQKCCCCCVFAVQEAVSYYGTNSEPLLDILLFAINKITLKWNHWLKSPNLEMFGTKGCTEYNVILSFYPSYSYFSHPPWSCKCLFPQAFPTANTFSFFYFADICLW